MRPIEPKYKRKDRTKWMQWRPKNGKYWRWKSICQYGCCLICWKHMEMEEEGY